MSDIEQRLREAMDGVTEAYRISEDGRVFSISSNWRGYGEREMCQEPNADGYPSVRITIHGQRKRIAVHRLVALCHLPPRPSLDHEIRHLNGNKNDPNFLNLAWGTRSENALDRQRHGTERAAENAAKTIDKRKGELCATAKLNNEDARAIRSRFQSGEPASEISKDYPQVTYWAVNNVARGKTFKELSHG